MVHFSQFTVTDQIICHCCCYGWISSGSRGKSSSRNTGHFLLKVFNLFVSAQCLFLLDLWCGWCCSLPHSDGCSQTHSPAWCDRLNERLNAASACFASDSAPLIFGSKSRHSSCPVGVLLKHRVRCLQHQDRKYREIKLQQGGQKTLKY